jgi:hypothetical protein
MDALVAEDAAEDPAMRALLARASATANFLDLPKAKAAGLSRAGNSSKSTPLHP